MNTKINKRWAIVNRNTGRTRTSAATRDAARISKGSNERIFDTVNGIFVR
jgi:hypothetical protein